MRNLVFLALVGCGRIGFDPVGGANADANAANACVRKIVAHARFTCAIVRDGSVWCMGANVARTPFNRKRGGEQWPSQTCRRARAPLIRGVC